MSTFGYEESKDWSSLRTLLVWVIVVTVRKHNIKNFPKHEYDREISVSIAGITTVTYISSELKNPTERYGSSLRI